MRLTLRDLQKVLRILEKIDRGMAEPELPDRIGRFLSQYKTGRTQLDQVLAKHGAHRRADAAVSGRLLGSIDLSPILEPQVNVLGFPQGEVANTLAISEELGALTNLVMWLKGPTASSAYNIVTRDQRGLRLSADYRWSPPSRITTGEASAEPAQQLIEWYDARCMKAVADDLPRLPHALEYVLDYRKGPPGLKFFRTICAQRNGNNWEVLPAFADKVPLDLSSAIPEALRRIKNARLAKLLVYCEPWSRDWTIVDGIPIDAAGAFDHAVAWADFKSELEGLVPDGSMRMIIEETLDNCGLPPGDSVEMHLSRKLLPVARAVTRWLRGYK